MAHNTSRTKQLDIERERRIGELTPFLVPGWQINRNRIEVVEIDTILGAWQRGQEIMLRCRKTDCSRRAVVDLRAAVQCGLGDHPRRELVQILRCGHWNGCEIEEVHAIYPKGVPLVSYLNHRDTLIVVTCSNCSTRLLLPPAAIIERLKRAGTGDGSTGVIELGSVVRGPCRQCGQRRFTSDVVRPKALGT